MFRCPFKAEGTVSSCWASHRQQPWARPSPGIRLSWRKLPSLTPHPLSGAASIMFRLDVQLPDSRSGHFWRASQLPRAPQEAEALAVTAKPPSVSSAQELAILRAGPKKPPVTKSPAQNGFPGDPSCDTLEHSAPPRCPTLHSSQGALGVWAQLWVWTERGLVRTLSTESYGRSFQGLQTRQG